MDRQLLPFLAPLLMAEFRFDQVRYGFLLSAFSIAYALASLFMGWFLDRVGINRGISAAVAWWSTSAACTGLVSGVAGLGICRAALGIGEAAGVPAVGKLNGMYLRPGERALGAALNQVGLSLGAALVTASSLVATRYSWRVPFVVMGVLGLLWIPLWLAVSRAIPYTQPVLPPPASTGETWSLLRDRNLILLVVANVLWMGAYSIWFNWTTLYLVNVHGLTLKQAAGFVWIPPLVSNLGGFFGGWLSLRWMSRGVDTVAARRRAVFVGAAGMLSTLLLPLASNPVAATSVISASFFFALAGSVNIYALPIDLYGPSRAGFTISALTFAFGVLQTVISPIVGWLGDHRLYHQVAFLAAVPPVLGALTLAFVTSPRQSPEPSPVQ